jgi:hypothetical protein
VRAVDQHHPADVVPVIVLVHPRDQAAPRVADENHRRPDVQLPQKLVQLC